MYKKKIEQYGGAFLKKLQEVTRGDREAWGAPASPGAGGAASAGPVPVGIAETGAGEAGTLPFSRGNSIMEK